MNKVTTMLAALGVVSLLAPFSAVAQTPAPATPARGPAAPAMTLTSSAWPDGADIPVKYTQAGAQVQPQLAWTNTPAGTQSFVILMHDPDVSLNNTTDDQLHWLVWNLPATTTSLPEQPQGTAMPGNAPQISASGAMYRGPGAGAAGPKHHYTIEVFALDTKLDVQPAATWQDTRSAVLKAMQGHVKGKAVYVGLFHRPQ